MKASERLAQELHALGDLYLEQRARSGYYGDFTSPLATPMMQLVDDLMKRGYRRLATRAMNGEFDGE